MQCVSRFILVSMLLVAAVAVEATDVVQALWTFNDYADGETIPDGGIVRDESGQGRHLVNRRANSVTTANSPNGSSAIVTSGIDGGTGPRGATDFLEFIPGFSGFSNSALSAANNPFVFPAGLHWMVEFVATDHQPVNHAEGCMVQTGDFDDLGGIDRVSADLTANQIDFVHWDANDPGQVDKESPFCRATGLTPPYYHHIALVRDRQNDKLQIYRNGTVADEEPGVGGGVNVENTSGNLYVCPQIVAYIEAAQNARLYRGEIDFIRIVTRDTFGAGSPFGPDDFYSDFPPPATGTVILIK